MEEAIGRQGYYLKQSKLFNPNWIEAENHGKASRVGFSNLSSEKARKRCICCLQQIEKDQIPLSENTKELQFLGFGFPLYYSFVRNCIFLLLVSICSYNLISLHRAISQSHALCSKPPAKENNTPTHPQANLPHNSQGQKGVQHMSQLSISMRHFYQQKFQSLQQRINPLNQLYVNKYFQSKNQPFHLNSQYSPKQNKLTQASEGGHGSSEQNQNQVACSSWMIFLARIQKQVGLDEQIIRAGSILIHMILLVYIENKLIKKKDYFDERNATPSDYSILMKKIPASDSSQGKNVRYRIKQRIFQEYKIDEIQEIILIPDMEHFQELQHQKHKAIEKLRTKVKKGIVDEQYRQFQNEIHLMQHKIRKYIVDLKIKYNSGELQAQKAILICSTQDAKQEILRKYKQKKFQEKSWQSVKIQEAPQPRQFIWQNISLSQSTKARLTLVGWFLSILLLAILTVIFAFLSKAKSTKVQQQMQEYRRLHNTKYQGQAMALVFGMIFFVVVFNKIVIANLFHYFTDLQRHSSTHNFQFHFCLKYCLGLFFTTALMTLIVQAFILKNYYRHDYGVVQEQTIMYLINSLFVPFFWAINPLYLFKRFVLSISKNKNYFTQQQANQLSQYPGYDVGKRYGQVLQIMWFTYLYMTLIPIGAVISCIGLILYYWIDKYNLLYRSSIKSNVSGKLIFLTLKMLNFTLVLRTAGDLIFDDQIRNGPQVLSFVLFGISVIYQLLPIRKLINKFYGEKFKSQSRTYQVAQLDFKQTYYDQHLLFSHLKEDRDNLSQELINRLTSAILKNNKKSQIIS